ncbi:TetR/AcrR family transcriptional regulator [Cryptosporangium minutisporangium]|uniref:TetR/AcrR family transcriptional regulator n=1 Tax=Cryptosporangium minutisporangium TaxID=113569 RepID=A0ABP6SS64_9ACTN
MPSSPPPVRSDAKRNRARILHVANAELTQGDAVPSLAEIARRAGVGQATAYRHFPDRRAIALAVTREQLAVLGDLVEQTEPHNFRWLLEMVLIGQASMRPLVTLTDQLTDAEREWCTEQVISALTGPMLRCQAVGGLREGVGPGDLRMVMTMLEGAIAHAAIEDRSRTALRAITVLLDGLFSGRPGSD